MGRKRSDTLTDGELKIMRVFWQQGPATVADVVEALTGTNAPAYNTVQTMVRILERKGYVRHRAKEGRAFVFEPRIDESQARQSALRHLLNRFFDDSPGTLVMSLLEHERVSDDEMRLVESMLRDREGR
jgi:predicted transcriptional regulator